VPSGRQFQPWLALLIGLASALLTLVIPRAAMASQMPAAQLVLVGFCDARGATGVAPLPAMPVQGGELDADLSGQGACASSAVQPGANLNERQDAPGHDRQDPAPLDAGLPPLAPEPLFPLQQAELPRPEARLLVLPRGYTRQVEHPPRG
jgi:hypothetical protein